MEKISRQILYSNFETVKVYDWDMVGSADFMGQVAIPVSTLNWNGKSSKWYNLSVRTEDTEKSQRQVVGDIRLKMKYTVGFLLSL